MKAHELQDAMDTFHKERSRLMFKKGEDYADYDILSNFKRVGEALEQLKIDELPGPLMYAFTMIINKIDRWGNLIRKGTVPRNESVSDTVQDLLNYVDLAYAVQSDMDNEAAKVVVMPDEIIIPDCEACAYNPINRKEAKGEADGKAHTG